MHRLRRIVVEIDVDRAALLDVERAQVVDAVGVVGVLVGVEHGIEVIDVGCQELLAQVRRSVDQHAGDSSGAAPFDQKRSAPAPVLRITRIAGAPAQGRARHAAR